MWQTTKLWSFLFWCLLFKHNLGPDMIQVTIFGKAHLKYLSIKKSNIWLMSGTQIGHLRSPFLDLQIRPSELFQGTRGTDRCHSNKPRPPWWVCYGTHRGGFLEVAKDNPNRWKLGRRTWIVGGQKSHRFLKGLYPGDLYILLLQGSRGKPPKNKNGKTRTNY